jgi:hypothetical protein
MLNDLKEIEKFFKICRKQGVSDVSFEGISVKFGELPSKQAIQTSDESDEITTDELTPEQLMFYAVGGQS